ncbi:hypothetical protein EG328_011783 [Venturia inaequalis]|uniref:Glucose-methanol-choline oxidoreductase N-terminal domain-containing protein n=1 Tax=Venturia inaequalis TaxID=5025 RepID=A0A8H3Z2X2_VENIN|nr:hypothetical protein EG328_011783 [Venturia inaequalis]KAE9992228.1 hypothetical protein EG327_009726 [Venturia inaequalis]RDI88880.1 hypothetical protein Vi05172_g1562 [Venturia inaequalis]
MHSSFFATLFLLLTSSYTAGAQQLYSNHFGKAGVNASYDYVIVGGGTAGLAIAYRLAEDGSKTVAVIEAGGFYETDGGNTSVVPAYCVQYGNVAESSAKDFPLTDWGFLTTPQAGLNNRTLHYGRGKMLGGSSSENAAIYNRGTTGSYQVWADLVGDQSWTFENILPYFARGIKFTGVDPNNTTRAANASIVPPPANPNAINASGFPLTVGYSNWAMPYGSWISRGMAQLGFPVQQDFISGSLLGSQIAPVTILPDQTRASSQSTYLDVALASGRTNLKVYTYSLAKRIIFSSNKTATGVQVVSGISEPYILSAKSEVILSAGAFQSPQLLMVSGVGPKEQLQRYNITVVADRPGVGQNMQDHLDFGPVYYVNLQGQTGGPSAGNDAAVEQYLANRTGFLTNFGVDFIGWEKLPAANRVNFTAQTIADLAKYPADWPEIEYEITEAPLGGLSRVTGTPIAIPVTPISRGTVTISSNDMSDPPIINPNWLTSPTDIQVAIEAFKRSRAMAEASSARPIQIGEEVMPGRNVTSDDDIHEYIKNSAYQNWHASCTCRMGNVTDPMAVVDSRARVIGVNSLRVVDASSFALLPPGHPQSTVYLMAEKISADITDNW